MDRDTDGVEASPAERRGRTAAGIRGGHLHIEEAERLAWTILQDPLKFTVVQGRAVDYPYASELAGATREFFHRIESVKAVRGDAELVRSSIAPSILNPEYLCIGHDIESVEVVVRAGEEKVYELDAFDVRQPFSEHRSIYHWVIATADDLYGR